ncbi:hypothetical protein D3C71_1918390 [compost metagenome]
MGFDDFEQRLPGHHQFHLGKEDFAPGLLPLARLLRIRKTDLAHRSCSFARFSPSCKKRALDQTFPNAKRDDVARPVGGRRGMEGALPYAMIGGVGLAWERPNLLESSV